MDPLGIASQPLYSSALHRLLLQGTLTLDITPGVTWPAQYVFTPLCESRTLEGGISDSLTLLLVPSFSNVLALQTERAPMDLATPP